MQGTPHKGLFPEFNEMIAKARQYHAKEIHFSELYGAVQECQMATKVYSARIELCEIAEEWAEMLGRLWNEFLGVDVGEEISEEEFRAWVAEQLRVFEPFDPVARVRGTENTL